MGNIFCFFTHVSCQTKHNAKPHLLNTRKVQTPFHPLMDRLYSLYIKRETQEYQPWEHCCAESFGLRARHASTAPLCCQFLQMGFKPSNPGLGATALSMRPVGFSVPSIFIADILECILNWFGLVYRQVTTSVLNRRKNVNVIPAGYRQYEILKEKYDSKRMVKCKKAASRM